MSSTLAIKVATTTSTRTFTKTDAEMANIIKLFMAKKAGVPPEGMTVAQTNQWWLDQAMDEIVEYIKGEARRNREDELRKASPIEAQAETETNF